MLNKYIALLVFCLYLLVVFFIFNACNTIRLAEFHGFTILIALNEELSKFFKYYKAIMYVYCRRRFEFCCPVT